MLHTLPCWTPDRPMQCYKHCHARHQTDLAVQHTLPGFTLDRLSKPRTPTNKKFCFLGLAAIVNNKLENKTPRKESASFLQFSLMQLRWGRNWSCLMYPNDQKSITILYSGILRGQDYNRKLASKLHYYIDWTNYEDNYFANLSKILLTNYSAICQKMDCITEAKSINFELIFSIKWSLLWPGGPLRRI